MHAVKLGVALGWCSSRTGTATSIGLSSLKSQQDEGVSPLEGAEGDEVGRSEVVLAVIDAEIGPNEEVDGVGDFGAVVGGEERPENVVGGGEAAGDVNTAE